MMLYWAKNYFSRYFSHRYFQIRGEKVILGPYTIAGAYKKLKTDKDELLNQIDVQFPGSELKIFVNDVLVKIHRHEDEEIILTLLSLNLQNKNEKENIEFVKLIISLIEQIEENEKKSLLQKQMLEEDEEVAIILNTILGDSE